MAQNPSTDAAHDEVARARELLVEERRSIDNIDAALVHLLAERFSHTQRVGVLKATHGLPPADPSRERAQIDRLRSLAHDAGLDPVFAEAFLRFIVTEVIRHHERIRDEGTTEA
ncbi:MULTISPECIES: chorismate mutase [unclassified Brachybacterium]|uniref:chorismate mutase n=1 Tax=unclassified Brachybacterium TaxID=2623841 RepID=UPI004034278C